jgi:hypothetical protein
MTIIVNQPNSAGIAQAQNQSALIAAAAQPSSITSNKFVFFAAFDGTNNNRANLAVSGSKQDTNVAQLATQVDNSGNPNVIAKYYQGPGGDPANGNGLGTAATQGTQGPGTQGRNSGSGLNTVHLIKNAI